MQATLNAAMHKMQILL